jgi:hypothetical protein
MEQKASDKLAAKDQRQCFRLNSENIFRAVLKILPAGNGLKNFYLGTVFQSGIFIQSLAIHVNHSQALRRKLQIRQKVMNRCFIRKNGLKAA